MSRDRFYPVNVPVQELLLDTSNPRIRRGVDQRDCISKLLRRTRTFMNLLLDIAQHGLTIDPIVISRNHDGKWVVRDGNRRVAALKLLNDPDLCPDPILKKEIKKLAETNRYRIPDTIQCLACDDERTILRYIELKHTGENQGVGQEGWRTLTRAIFNLNHNLPDQDKRAAQLVLWAEEQGIRVDDDFPLTTLSRILKRETLALLGFRIENDELAPILDTESVRRLVDRVIYDLQTGRIDVNDVREPHQQLDYIRGVRTELGPPISVNQDVQAQVAVTASTTSTPTPATVPTAPTRSHQESMHTQVVTPRQVARSSRVSRPSWERKRLLPKKTVGFDIPSEHTKARNVLAELSRLDVTKTPIAAALLFRLFIELSVLHYRELHDLPDKGKLASNVAGAAEHMFRRGAISHRQHEIILRHTREPGGILHVNTLHGYVHSEHFHPSPQVLNTMWDEISFFLAKCWEQQPNVST